MERKQLISTLYLEQGYKKIQVKRRIVEKYINVQAKWYSGGKTPGKKKWR
jgi:hypothetical protein